MPPSSRQPTHRPLLPITVSLLVSLLLAGCGAERYENRLDRTVRYFRYLDELERNLAEKPWQGSGVRIRVPDGFDPAAPPTARAELETSSGGVPESVRRAAVRNHPDFASALPGIVGAWRADMNVRGGESRPAWLYVLSNHDLWLGKAPEETAPHFHEDLVTRLVSRLNLSDPNPGHWSTLFVPPKEGRAFIQRKKFRAIGFKAVPIGDRPHTLRLYEYETGDMQVALLFVIPRDAVERDKLLERIPLALQTLHVSPTRPRRPNE